MHTVSVIVGALLALNCGFCLLYLARTELRKQRGLQAIGASYSEYRRELPFSAELVPLLHVVGFSAGLLLLWWGL